MADTHSKSICATLADYRHGEIAARTPADVDRWINQFDKGDRDVVLQETDRLLQKHYVSGKAARAFIDSIWATQKLMGASAASTVGGFKFLEVARKGASQGAMIELARSSLKQALRLDLDACGKSPTAYVYLDDCLFSGNTVVHDLKDHVDDLAKNSTVHMVFLGGHNGGVRYITKALAPILAKRGIKHNVWTIPTHTFQNLPWEPESFQPMWPTEVKGDKLVDAYLARVQKACEGKSFTPRLFRPQARTKEDVFSSPAARQAVETAFLRKGAFIVAQCQNPKDSMRPLGYEYLSSLGFGALIVTYRNIANNCPLALWWGDPNAAKSHPLSKWFPLIPRRSNQETASSSFSADDYDF
jgi:hypothetical protein